MLKGYDIGRRGYKDKPNTVVIQYIVLFSHFTVLLPSDALSQKHDAAVCRPAPAYRTMQLKCIGILQSGDRVSLLVTAVTPVYRSFA